jgi:hypothetical protein
MLEKHRQKLEGLALEGEGFAVLENFFGSDVHFKRSEPEPDWFG